MNHLIERCHETGRWNLYLVLAMSSAVACLLVVARVWYYDTDGNHFFLGWNLFLAMVPFAISQWMLLFPPRSNAALFTGLFFWLLFFPNAPYLMTDLFHLSDSTHVPIWYDIVLFLAFAWNGLILGFLSLFDMQGLIESRFGRGAGWLFATGAIVLGSFGIYIGRFLRWNSWDVFTRPGALFADIADHALHPFTYPGIYAYTLLFAAFLMLGYLTLRSLIELKAPSEVYARARE
jgi:uncharacterized membrane protein